MILYTPSAEHDLALELWFHELRVNGELPLIFTHPDCQRLGYFLFYFTRPRELVFDVDDKGQLIRAVWFDPFDIGARQGLWIHPAHRKSQASLEFALTALESGLATFGVLFTITIQPRLIEPHQHLGYTVLTETTEGCDGHHVWLLMLTKAGLEGSACYGKRRGTERSSADAVTAEREPV